MGKKMLQKSFKPCFFTVTLFPSVAPHLRFHKALHLSALLFPQLSSKPGTERREDKQKSWAMKGRAERQSEFDRK